MKIIGFEKTSFIDYPGKISSVVFTPRCNFKCPYCYNYKTINTDAYINEKTVFDHLEKRKDVIQALVVTGGEPTLQPDLLDFLKKVKQKGFLVKLDSNGTNPDVLQKALDERLVDYLAMDIKAPLERYSEIVGVPVDTEKIRRSIQIMMTAPDYEFRTTVFPALTKDDFFKIRELIKGAKNYYLQQFVNKNTLSADGVKPYEPEELNKFKEIMQDYVKHVEIRGI